MQSIDLIIELVLPRLIVSFLPLLPEFIFGVVTAHLFFFEYWFHHPAAILQKTNIAQAVFAPTIVWELSSQHHRTTNISIVFL